MQYDVAKVGILEASHEKLAELESMTKYLNEMITRYLSPDGIYASSSASRESISDYPHFR